MYAFFKPTPSIVYISDCCVHVFECSATQCMGRGNSCMVRCYLDTGDAKSTSNAEADKARDVHAAHEAISIIKLANGSIMDAFE